MNRLVLHRAAFLILILVYTLPLSAEPLFHITFEKDAIGSFPAGWVSENARCGEVYTVQAEGGLKFLHADARETSIQIGYERKWSLNEFPVMQWEWRPIRFPVGSDERIKKGGDSVLGVYVVFGSSLFMKSIKYIWSDTLPVGASFDSPFSSSSKMLVVRSGQAQAGQWVTEQRDVLADYRQLFQDKNAEPVASGIAILTDSDNTKSRAIGDYGGIKIMKTKTQNQVQHQQQPAQ